MSVLTREKIIECMKNGQITITPQIDDSQIGCASVDLTLSNEFRFYKPGLEVLDVDEQVDYRTITEKIVLKEGEKYLLLPNCACLAITKETISLTGDLCGLLEGRSRFARLGLFVHITVRKQSTVQRPPEKKYS
jgi:dCTP deaminase